MWQNFNHLFVVVGDDLKMAITNDRRVVVRYNTFTLSTLTLAPFAKELREWIQSGTTPLYTTAVSAFNGRDLAPDVFNEFCGLYVEQ